MLLLVELLVGFGIVAVAASFVALAWYLIPVVLVVVGVQGYRKQAAVKRYEADLQAGRVTATRVERCSVCADSFTPCQSCVQRHQAV
jgi:hypothetical protein